MRVARSRIVRVDESPLESCLRDRGYGDVADELGARHAYTGRASGGAGVTPRSEIRTKTGQGFLDNPWNLSNGNATVAFQAGTTFAAMCGLRVGEIVTNINVYVAGAAVGTPPTLVKAALMDKTCKVLAATANNAANARWLSIGVATIPLTAPFTITAEDVYYAAFLFTGAWGTTQPNYMGTIGSVGAGVGTLSPVRALIGQTDLVVGTTYAMGGGGTNPMWIVPS